MKITVARALPLASRVAGTAVASIAAAALAMALWHLPACSVYSNFPPDSADRFVDPYFPPMPQVMATAIRFAHSEQAPNTPLIWNIPAGARYAVWEKAAQYLPAGAEPMTSVDQSVFSLRQIRINGGRAQADIVYRSAGVWSMATVHLSKHGPMQVFRADYLQSWTIPVEAPTPNRPAKPIEPGTVESAIASDPSIPAGK
ncbi:MAG: hypothetical protein O2819_08555 [Planctomycetota bacterium]|nr:hypothetical protein [Planctomycetota bacterium]MDA1105886.1 hypothetical protein [Planctomycetota bacterium]